MTNKEKIKALKEIKAKLNEIIKDECFSHSEYNAIIDIDNAIVAREHTDSEQEKYYEE